MAVTNAVGALYAARLEANFMKASRWRALVDDHSVEVPYGNELVINRDNTTYSIADYTVGTNLGTPGRIDLEAANLELNQQKAINIYIDDIETRQVRPTVVNEVTRRIGQEMAQTVDGHLRGQAIAGIGSDRILTKIKGGATLNDIKDTPVPGIGDDMVSRMTDASELAEDLYWPESGRVCVMSPKMKRAIIDYLLRNKFTFSGNINDSAYQNFAIANTLGWRPVVDPAIPKTGADAFRSFFLLVGEGLAYAEQYSRSETIRDPEKFGDILRRLMVYGAVRAHPDKVFTVPVTAEAR